MAPKKNSQGASGAKRHAIPMEDEVTMIKRYKKDSIGRKHSAMMLNRAAQYPLRLPLRMVQRAPSGDRAVLQGVALLVSFGLCISSFSLLQLSYMPHKPRRLL